MIDTSLCGAGERPEQVATAPTVCSIASTCDLNDGIAPADILRDFATVMAALGGSAETFVDALARDPSLRFNPDMAVSFNVLAKLLGRAAAVLGCFDLGMRMASAPRPNATASLFELVMRNSQTVAEAFEYSVRHGLVHSGKFGFSMGPANRIGQTSVILDMFASASPGLVQLTEYIALRTCRIIRDSSDNSIAPTQVRFRHSSGVSPERYRELFGAPVLFEQSQTGFDFEDGQLADTISGANPQLRRLATYYIENRFASIDMRVSRAVRNLVDRDLASNDLTIEKVADALGMHVRTLQRRLRDEQTSFDRIKDGVRRDRAFDLLADPSVPFAQVAHRIGYAEVSALTRSSYRWFASNPRSMRARLSRVPGAPATPDR